LGKGNKRPEEANRRAREKYTIRMEAEEINSFSSLKKERKKYKEEGNTCEKRKGLVVAGSDYLEDSAPSF